MGSTTETKPWLILLSRYAPLIGVGVFLLGGIIIRTRFGPPGVVLWMAFCALAGATLLFWEALRAVLDPQASDETELTDTPVMVERTDEIIALEQEKLAALKAVKELEFEFSLQRISERDYQRLNERYRQAARDAMKKLDQLLGEHLHRAEDLVEESVQEHRRMHAKDNTLIEDDVPAQSPPFSAEQLETDVSDKDEGSTAKKTKIVCSNCETSNDLDAVFCKKCGTKFVSEST